MTRMDVEAAQRLVVIIDAKYSHVVVQVVAIPDHDEAIEPWVVDPIRVAMRERTLTPRASTPSVMLSSSR
jgi:hypothetical protein